MSLSRRGIKQPPHSWHGIHQNELTLMLTWRAQGAFALIKKTQNVQEAKTSYLQHHKIWGPRGRACRQSSPLLLPSSSDQGIYLDGEDYSRQTLHTPSENKERIVRLADEALRTPHVHSRSKFAAFYPKNITGLYCSCKLNATSWEAEE